MFPGTGPRDCYRLRNEAAKQALIRYIEGYTPPREISLRNEAAKQALILAKRGPENDAKNPSPQRSREAGFDPAYRELGGTLILGLRNEAAKQALIPLTYTRDIHAQEMVSATKPRSRL